jgi:hypothetical protein
MNREEGEATGEHNYVVVKTEEATCQTPAYFWFECTECGAEKNYEDKTGKLGEHNYEVVKTEEATCQYPAYYWYECSECGAEMNREEGTANAEAHKWNDGEVTTEPTVDAEGVKTFTCTDCGETKTEAIEKLDHAHEYESVVTAPTCTEAGYTTYTCECGDSYVAEEVEALGHTEVSANNAVEATCTTTGKEADIVCDVCGITVAEGAVIAVKDHNHVAGEVKAPTCTEGGYTTYTCECGDSYVADETEALGHNVKKSYKFNDDFSKRIVTSTCTVCGEVVSVVEEDY